MSDTEEPDTIKYLDDPRSSLSSTFVDPDVEVHDAFDDVAEGVTMPAATHVLAEDGLPRAVDPGALSGLEIPLSPDTLVCMKKEGRPQCKNYVRQMFVLRGEEDKSEVQRFCLARQGGSGAFVDVSGGVRACDMRDPPDIETQKKIDVFDEIKIAQGVQRLSETQSVFGTKSIFGVKRG